MASRAYQLAGEAQPDPRRATVAPTEGWAIILLHGAIVVAAAWAVARGGWGDVPPSVPFVATGGALIGLLLARLRFPDLLAHLTAFAVGTVMIVAWTAATFEELGEGWRVRVAEIWELGREWLALVLAGKQHDEERALFVVLLGVTFWLVAYMTAWTLYRRRWLTAAVVLPGFVIVVNLGYAPNVGPGPLAAYLVAAGALAARHFAYRRQQEWARFGIPAPAGLAWRFLGVGGNVTIALVVLAWSLPLTAESEVLARLHSRLEGPLEEAQQRWDEWLPVFPNPRGRPPSSFASFDEAFQLGGALELSDDPVVVLQADRPMYLVAARYDAYTGRGWRTDVTETFDSEGPNGRTYSPEVTFAATQPVALSDAVDRSRREVTGTLILFQSNGELLLTVETFNSADLPTSVQLSWRQLDDEPFDIARERWDEIPPDLRPLAALLLQSSFLGDRRDQATGLPLPDDTEMARLLLEEREALEDRLLTARWEIAPDGEITLYVSGQLPIYDDIEAVYGQAAVPAGQSYTVVGLASQATPEQLTAAGTDYPLFVESRYLQLPETVTPRTRDLAEEIAAGYDNPFAIARAVESFVRGRIAYDLDIERPPEGQDVVDYVLFESRVGYCEYYASAMVVLLRALDIPARMVVGFHAVDLDPSGTGYLYRARDAHAWVEVYFPGYGWIPFEPTRSQPVLDYGTFDASRTPTPQPTAPPLPTVAPTSEVETPPVSTPSAAGPITDTPGDDRGDRLPWLLAAGVGLVGGGSLAVAAWTLLWRRGLRGLSPVGAHYARMLRIGRWLGVRPEQGLTPYEYAGRLGQVAPEAGQAATRLADLYTAERYGGRVGQIREAGEGASAWRQLRGIALRARFLPFQRGARARDGAVTSEERKR